MERLKELEADREDRREVIKGHLEAAAKDKRSLSEDERAAVDTLTAELDQIQATIKAEEQVLAWDRTEAPAINKPTAKPSGFNRNLGGASNPWGDCSSVRGSQAAFGAFLQAVAMSAKGSTPDPRLSMPLAAASGLNTGV
ncbi:MAG TPA: hypothetical protein VMZ50_02795, partial [Phycisphaerae bacterium]|nr:hypothetical protein [Phycisphaerae bacterium]